MKRKSLLRHRSRNTMPHGVVITIWRFAGITVARQEHPERPKISTTWEVYLPQSINDSCVWEAIP